MRNAQLNIFDEIIVDNFAGGGGASTGIELAAGRPVDIAVPPPFASALVCANLPEWCAAPVSSMSQVLEAVSV